MEVFMIDNALELKTFVEREKFNGKDNGVEWVLNGDLIVFESDKQEKLNIPSNVMINRSLEYAVELERIV